MNARLADIADALEAGEVLSESDLALVVAVLRSRPPAESAAIARGRRNELIRKYRLSWCAKCRSVHEAARQIERDARRYAAGEWRWHAHKVSCPDDIEGTARGDLWELFKCCPPEKFLTASSIRRILS